MTMFKTKQCAWKVKTCKACFPNNGQPAASWPKVNTPEGHPKNGGKMARKMGKMARNSICEPFSGHFFHFPGHFFHFPGHFSPIFQVRPKFIFRPFSSKSGLKVCRAKSAAKNANIADFLCGLGVPKARSGGMVCNECDRCVPRGLSNTMDVTSSIFQACLPLPP